jgi:hypothetical protein
MAKWQYRRLTASRDESTGEFSIAYQGSWGPYSDLMHILNEWGKEGWELVGNSSRIDSLHPEGSPYTITWTRVESFYFKRQHGD